MLRVVASFVRLRWRLLRGAVRHGGTEQIGAIISTVASALIGLGAGAAIAIVGRSSDEPVELAVIACALLMVAVLGFGIVAGISQPIDPRVLAAEPLDDRTRAAGLLAAAALGPPGLAGIAIGSGLAVGMVRGPGTVPVVAVGVLSWLLGMLLVARTATNLLAMMTSRFPRAGQLVVGLAGLVFYGTFQFVRASSSASSPPSAPASPTCSPGRHPGGSGVRSAARTLRGRTCCSGVSALAGREPEFVASVTPAR